MSISKKNHGNKSILLQSLLINLDVLIFCIFVLDIKYEVSDDHMIDSVLSGAFNEKGSGFYDANLLFSNILLGYPLKLLYMLIPKVSWYFVFLIAVAFVSLTTVTYMLLSYAGKKPLPNIAGIAIAIIFLVYYAVDMYTLLQFTKVGAAAVVSGGSFFLSLLWNKDKKHRIPGFTAAILITMIGVFIRSQVIGVTVPFLVLQFVFYIFEGAPSKNYIRTCIKRFIVCAFLIGAALLLDVVGKAVFIKSKDYKEFQKYSLLRSHVTDTLKFGYDDVKDAFKLIGFDEVDYYMFKSWSFNDRNIYTDDNLEYVSAVFKEKSKERTHSLEYILDQMVKRGYTSYHIFIGLVILMIITLFIRTGNPIWHIGNMIMTFIILGLLFWSGRIVYRVEFGAFFSAAVTAIVCGLFPRLQSVGESQSAGELHVNDDIYPEATPDIERVTRQVTGYNMSSHDTANTGTSRVCLFSMITVIIANLFLFVPDTNYKNLTDAEYTSYINNTVYKSSDYVSGKYRARVNSRRPYGNLIDYIEADDESYYLMDFSSCIQLIYFDYKPWERLPVGYFDENYMYLGGVTMQYPAERELMERHGLDPDNPYKDIVKDGIYVVDNKYYDVKLQYLRKYYYPNARKELVDTIDGFKIWKFYAE